MEHLNIQQLVLGMVQTNCYLVTNSKERQTIIIDPADQTDTITSKLTAMGVKPVAIFLTHGHFDHMLAADALRKRYEIPVYALDREEEILTDAGKNLSAHWSHAHTMSADRYVKDGEKLQIAGFEAEVLHTPGHTVGSCCYYFSNEEVLFSGDTLFAESVGRTDFPTSSAAKMRESLKRLLFELPEQTKVYPGHGEMTTIGHEKRYNPFA